LHSSGSLNLLESSGPVQGLHSSGSLNLLESSGPVQELHSSGSLNLLESSGPVQGLHYLCFLYNYNQGSSLTPYLSGARFIQAWGHVRRVCMLDVASAISRLYKAVRCFMEARSIYCAGNNEHDPLKIPSY